MLSRKHFPLFAVMAVLAAAAPLGTPAQAVSGEARTTLLTTARSQYYNLRAAGVKSFACNVDVDWNGLFTSVNGKPPVADDPLVQYLTKSRFSVKTELGGSTEATWTNPGAAPAGAEKPAQQMQGGLKQTLEGFFDAWMPSLNGTLIAMSPKSLNTTAEGYVLDDSTEKEMDQVTMDKKLVITHLSTKSDAMHGEMNTTFTPSAKGLLLTTLDGVYQQPATAPGTHVIMSTTYQPVQNYQLPAAVKFTVENVATFKMQLTGCTVEKQP
jgi:hypothetical protein